MSREVDQRVVEMQFNNANFEKNTRQSIATIDRLMEKLQFKGAEKGFEKLDAAAGNVDFDTMSRALDALESKFSAVNIMAVTTLVNITNKAVDAGTRLAKSLSIDQVTAGWNKYAQKTASVQTIMNATGKSITKVNSYLSKLMWFSDETSYSFTDMTQSLGQLTASGGNIEKVIPMIMGMANATAYAGKGASEFSRVIYNLNQSYSQGYLSLMDWKSVELAGVATAELKKQIIETGVALGKIKEGDVTVGTFSSTLSTKWADKEVMETAFGKFAEFSEAVKKMVDANPGMLASQAIEALADQYDEVTVKAFKAAQEAKSFSEAVDATKDAVSSGWMETFDILFGNYEEAKGFWSDLAEEFWNMFAGGAEARNSWLRSAFDSGLDQLLGTEGFSDATDNFTKALETSLVRRGVLSEKEIEDAGSFQKALEESGVTAQQLADVIGDQADRYARMAQLSDAELDAQDRDRSKVEALANAYGSLVEKIQNGTVNLEEFAGKMNQLSGREHFFAGVLNILEGINSVMDPVREAFNEVFMTDGSPLYNLVKGFNELTGKMKLSEATANKVYKVFRGLFSTLSIGLKTAKVALKTVYAVASKLLNLLAPIKDLLLSIASRFGDVLSYVNYSLGYAGNLTDVVVILSNAIRYLLEPVTELWKGIKTFVRGGDMDAAKKQFGAFGAVVDALGSVVNKFKIGSVSASGIIGGAVQLLGGILFAAFDGVGALIGNAFDGFKNAGTTVGDFATEQVPLLERIRDTVLSLPEKAIAVLGDFGGTIGSIMGNIATACRAALESVREFFNLQDGVDIYRLIALIDVGLIALAIMGVNKLLQTTNKAVTNLLKNPVTNFLDALTSAVKNWTKKNTTNNLAIIAKGIATAVGIMSVSVYLLSRIEDPTTALAALGAVMAELFAMVGALRLLTKADLTGLNTAKFTGTIIAISIGIGALTSAFVRLGKMHTYQIENGMNAISRISAVLIGISGMITVFNTYGDGMKGSMNLIAVAAAVNMVTLALIPLAMAAQNGLDIAGAAKVIEGIALALAPLTFAAALFNKWGSKLAEKIGDKAVNKITASIDNAIRAFQKTVSKLITLAGVAAALLIAAKAVSVVASTGDKMKEAIHGTAAIAVLLVALTGTLAVLSRTKLNPRRMQKMAVSMVLASAALVLMAEAVKRMTEAFGTGENGVLGFGAVIVGLAALSAAIWALSQRAMETTMAATALVAMGAALIEMAVATNMLADVQFPAIAANLGTLMVALLALVGMTHLIPTAIPSMIAMAKVIMTLATALLMLAPACYMLSGLSINQALAGVTGMLGILVGLGIVGSSPPIALGLQSVAVSMIALAKAFSIFAGGLIKFSIAAALLGVLSIFAEPICQVIIDAGPKIEEALTTLVTAICNTIINCAEPIAMAIVAMAKIGVIALVETIKWAWNGDGEEGSGIKGALEYLLARAEEWVPYARDHFINFVQQKLHEKPWYEWLFSNPIMDAQAQRGRDEFISDLESGPAGKRWKKVLGGGSFSSGAGRSDVSKSIENDTSAIEDNTDAINDNATATNSSTKKIQERTTATNISTKAQQAQAAGLIELTTDTGELVVVTEEQAKALLKGAEVTADAAAVTSESALAAQNNAKTVDATMTSIGSKSDKAEKAIATTIATASEKAKDTTEAEGEKQANTFLDALKDRFNALCPGMGEELQNSLNNVLGNLSVDIPTFQDYFSRGVAKVKDPLGLKSGNSMLTDEDQDEDTKKGKNDGNKGLTGSSSSGRSSSSKNKKTVAESIAEEYTKKLKANKYLQDALTKEITLWNLQNADAVSNEELLAKRSETASKSIELQVERVRIAQEQYDQLLKRAPKDDKTKDAYNTLLDEQASLEKLKQSRYDDIWDDILSRYENDSKTAENEYELWAAIYEDSASVTEKTNRKLEYINEKIATHAKVLTAAEEEYTQLKEEFGEENQRTQTAYRKYLEEQKNQQDLINDLEQAQLEQFDNQIARYEKAYKLIENRQQMLAKIYDDGSLSGQKDAYESAVNKYGKDSKEARAASRQGVMSSLVATGTALANATQSWKKLREYQEKYEKIENKNSDDALEAYAALQSEQYNFVSVAESLATALDLSDSGKKAMMQLGYTISKNWRPIQNGFAKVWAKLPQGMSDGITKGLDLVMSGGAAETMTSFAQTIVAAMTGDYATAIVAGMNTVIEFMNSDFGKKVMDGLGTLFAKTADKLGATDVGSDLLSTLIAGLAGKGDLLAGLGDGVVKVVGVIGSALVKLASMLGPEGVIVAAVAAVAGCAGLLIANWDKVKEWFEGFGTWLKDTFTGIWEGIKNFGKGIIDGFKKIFGIHSPSTVMDEIGGNIMKGLENGIRDSAEGVNQTLQDAGNAALDVAQLGAEKLLSLLNNVDEAYEPTIRPVVDLTDAKESAAWMDTNLVDGQRRVHLDVSRSANLADNVAQRAEAQKAANMKEAEKDHKNEMSNKDIVEAIGTLGGRIDSVAKAVSGMKVNINGKKLVGEILTDVDEGLGRRARG